MPPDDSDDGPEPGARSRAPNRRSSIYESPKGSGRWHGWVWVGTKPDGRPDRRHRRGRTQAEVTAAVRKLERERDAHAVSTPGSSRITVAAWAEEWLGIVESRGRAQSTLARYRTDLDMYILPRIGRTRLEALTAHDLEGVLRQMRADGLSVASTGTCFRAMRAMLREARKHGRMLGDPLATVHPPSAARPARPAGGTSLVVDEWAEPGDIPVTSRRTSSRALSVESVRDLLEVAAEDPDTLARWAIAVLCGLRQGEVLGLQWGRVDFDRRTLTIDRQLRRLRARHGCGPPTQRGAPAPPPGAQHADGTANSRSRRLQQRDWPCGYKRPSDCPQRVGVSGLALVPLKTSESERTIPVPSLVLTALAERLAQQRRDAVTACNLWQGPPPGHPSRTVFSTPLGGRIDPSKDYEAWQSLLRRAGIPPARLHDARHTAATLYLEAGVQEQVVRHQFGWTSGAMLPVYQHPTERLARAASDIVSGQIDLGGTR